MYVFLGGGGSNVDDALTVSSLERTSDKVTDNEVSYKPVETITAPSHYPTAHYSLLMPNPIWPFNRKPVEDKVSSLIKPFGTYSQTHS